ncbi:MAG: glucose 1-dehydrogenase [Dehalococcoidia bacterium]|nr:glucose 1-dehydrogenase [Dehalococcoidia bacterium]
MSVFDLFGLDGRVAVITGGSKGLGLWMAEALAEAGADIVLCARKLDQCEEAAQSIARPGMRTLALRCDVSSEDDVKALVDRTATELGRIDILINNAGFIWEEPLEETSTDRWARTIDVNLNGTFYCTREAGRHMIRQNRGKIINMASISGVSAPDPGLSNTVAYSAAKGAIVAFTRDLAHKWCRYNINVNAIAPGYFATKMSKYLVEQRHDYLMDAIRMKRLGQKDDIKGVALFLASDASNYMTGQTVIVDGGIVL